jgi:GMP synthase (glutamine-hydrolysing)
MIGQGGFPMQDRIVILGTDVPSGRAIARKLRTEHYECTLMAADTPAAQVAAREPAGVILAGEASEGAAEPDAALLTLGIPVLALGSSARALCAALRAEAPEDAETSEDAVMDVVLPITYKDTPLFADVAPNERWIAQARRFTLAEPYRVAAESESFPVAFADVEANIYLLQFQIERNDPEGLAILTAFAGAVCGCTPHWFAQDIIASAEAELRERAGTGIAICAVSGGLDSTVAATLARRALGDRARCVFVDTGLLREGEADATERYFAQTFEDGFVRVDASQTIFAALRGLSAPQDKRRVVEAEITRALAREIDRAEGVTVVVRGANYVDFIRDDEAEAAQKNALAGMVIEPLRELFKDEIRSVGEQLSIAPEMLHRQPFPGLGLAARIIGEACESQVRMLRRADALFCCALEEAGQAKRLTRYFAMLTTLEGQHVIALRATQGTEEKSMAARLPHDLLERAIDEILKELPAVWRVLYDITPGRAEWD